MNDFFAFCPDLVGRKVPRFELLSCIHVHQMGLEDKEYSIFCDAKFKSYNNVGEDVAHASPRYSALQYVLNDESRSLCEGQVVGIISYPVRNGKKNLFLLMNRFKEISDVEFFRRKLPQHIVQYDKVGMKIVTDVIPIDNVRAPLFYVPALDKGMDIDVHSNVHGKTTMYYVIRQKKVLCSSLLTYDDYLQRNNTFYSNIRGNSSFSYLNFNPFLNVDDMLNIKRILDVGRNKSSCDSDIVEAYEFDITEDGLDEMQVDEY